jgi:tungstate transport system substrate-binding protein
MGRIGGVDKLEKFDEFAAAVAIPDEGMNLTCQQIDANDFVVLGPRIDPARIASGKSVLDAFRKIAATMAPFISRGDRSGTNEAELRYWADAGIEINPAKDRWYREIGQGMGPALNMAASANAYLLSDRGTWLSFKNRGELAILVEGDRRLFNQYGVMLINPAKHPSVKVTEGQSFVDWLISANGQSTIGDYKIDGQQLFFPNAASSKASP